MSRTLRVVSWNLAYFTPRGFNSRANREQQWALIAALKPDIALLQECRPDDLAKYASTALEGYQIFGAIPPRWTACTAILVRPGVDAGPIAPRWTVLEHETGYVVAASAARLAGRSVLIASVHAPAREVSSEVLCVRGVVIPPYALRTSFHYDLIAPALDALRSHYDGFVIGGDWNSAPSMDDQDHFLTKTARAFRTYVTGLGWQASMDQTHSTEQRTWFRDGDAPYQLDHLFTDEIFHAELTRCEVLAEPFVPGLSDHALIVADFATGPTGLSAVGAHLFE